MKPVLKVWENAQKFQLNVCWIKKEILHTIESNTLTHLFIFILIKGAYMDKLGESFCS